MASKPKTEKVSMEIIEKKLTSFNSSQDSVQATSLWIMHHKSQHQKIVATWLKVLKTSSTKHRLTLFYLCNDVVQHAKKKKALYYLENFKDNLREAVHVIKEHASIKPNISRIFKIWEDRRTYDAKFINELRKIMANESTGDSSRDNSSANVTPKTPVTVVSPAYKPSPKVEQVEVMNVAETDGEAPSAAEFKPTVFMEEMTTLRKLESEVSLKTKQLASLRIDATNIEAIKQLKDRSHGNEFCNHFEESCRKIEDYVTVLGKEIEQSRKVLSFCDTAETFFDEQYREAKIVANAYKNFGARVTNMKKRVDDMKKIIPSTPSPVPSPSADAPSPGNTPPLQDMDDNDNVDMDLCEEDTDAAAKALEPGSYMPQRVAYTAMVKSIAEPIPSVTNIVIGEKDAVPKEQEPKEDSLTKPSATDTFQGSSILESRIASMLPTLAKGSSSVGLGIGQGPTPTKTLDDYVPPKPSHHEDRQDNRHNGNRSSSKSSRHEGRRDSESRRNSREESHDGGRYSDQGRHSDKSRDEGRHGDQSRHSDKSREESRHGDKSREEGRHGDKNREEGRHGDQNRHGDESRRESQHESWRDSKKESHDSGRHKEQSHDEGRHGDQSRDQGRNSDQRHEASQESHNDSDDRSSTPVQDEQDDKEPEPPKSSRVTSKPPAPKVKTNPIDFLSQLLTKSSKNTSSSSNFLQSLSLLTNNVKFQKKKDDEEKLNNNQQPELSLATPEPAPVAASFSAVPPPEPMALTSSWPGWKALVQPPQPPPPLPQGPPEPTTPPTMPPTSSADLPPQPPPPQHPPLPPEPMVPVHQPMYPMQPPPQQDFSLPPRVGSKFPPSPPAVSQSFMPPAPPPSQPQNFLPPPLVSQAPFQVASSSPSFSAGSTPTQAFPMQPPTSAGASRPPPVSPHLINAPGFPRFPGVRPPVSSIAPNAPPLVSVISPQSFPPHSLDSAPRLPGPWGQERAPPPSPHPPGNYGNQVPNNSEINTWNRQGSMEEVDQTDRYVHPWNQPHDYEEEEDEEEEDNIVQDSLAPAPKGILRNSRSSSLREVTLVDEKVQNPPIPVQSEFKTAGILKKPSHSEPLRNDHGNDVQSEFIAKLKQKGHSNIDAPPPHFHPNSVAEAPHVSHSEGISVIGVIGNSGRSASVKSDEMDMDLDEMDSMENDSHNLIELGSHDDWHQQHQQQQHLQDEDPGWQHDDVNERDMWLEEGQAGGPPHGYRHNSPPPPQPHNHQQLHTFVSGPPQPPPQGIPHGVQHGVPQRIPEGVQHGIPHGVQHGGPQMVREEVLQGILRGAQHGGPQRIPEGVQHGVPHGIPEGVQHGGPQRILIPEGVQHGIPQGVQHSGPQRIQEGIQHGLPHGDPQRIPEGVQHRGPQGPGPRPFAQGQLIYDSYRPQGPPKQWSRPQQHFDNFQGPSPAKRPFFSPRQRMPYYRY